MATNQVPSSSSLQSPLTASTLGKRLRKTSLAGIEPLPGVQKVKMKLIDRDPSNPGSSPYSERYKKREQPIHESYDVLGGVIYPLIVSSKDDGSGHFWLVDGQGRYDEAEKRGQEEINCIIFPRLELSHRILLRQVLNSAQQPIDPPLILRDLQIMADELHLDIRNSDADVEELLSQFPATFAEEMSGKLRVLAQWPKDITDKISIDVRKDDGADEPGTIGYRKIELLLRVVKKVRTRHPAIADQYPGEKLHRRVHQLYFDGAFRDGGRSQDGIERVKWVVNNADANEPLVADFLKGAIKANELYAKVVAKLQAKEAAEPPLVRVCNELKALLANIYPPELSAKEKFALKSTHTVLGEALEAIAAVKN